jgi:hypothetical protein
MCLRRWRHDPLGVARLWRRGCVKGEVMVICVGHAEETADVWNVWKVRHINNIVSCLQRLEAHLHDQHTRHTHFSSYCGDSQYDGFE